jgi:hypothetical protein
MNIQRVSNTSVWRDLRILFLAAPLIFLINIFFGFDNSLTVGEIPRWQLLIHLHGGSVGWITLCAVGIAIWVLTGQRTVSETYEQRIHYLVLAAVVIFGGYVLTFGIAFANLDGPLVFLLPLFGLGAVLVLWAGAIYSLAQLSKQSPMTTVHILAAGALLTAAVGATVGMLLGMERLVGEFLPLGPDRVGAHAGMMDTYLFLVAAAVIEWFGSAKASERWSYAGLAQAVMWAVGATMVPIAFFTNTVESVLPIFGLFLIVGMLLFVIRVGWRVLAAGPGRGRQLWIFAGTIGMLLYFVLFLYAVMGTGGDFSVLPIWFFAAFAHIGFVGMMTNVLMAVLSARAENSSMVSWGETAAFWTMNVGLILFMVLKIAADIRHGAIIMGIGVLLGVYTMVMRLRASQ